MRVQGWESLLNDYIEQARHTVFEWGQNDCALWSADWIKIATGRDHASQWRGLYASEAELEDLLLARGISSPQEIPTRVGLPLMDVAFAQRGDMVLHPHGHLGICNGMHGYFLMERGVTRIKTRDCTRAWGVR